jgi:hypothetical protein
MVAQIPPSGLALADRMFTSKREIRCTHCKVRTKQVDIQGITEDEKRAFEEAIGTHEKNAFEKIFNSRQFSYFMLLGAGSGSSLVMGRPFVCLQCGCTNYAGGLFSRLITSIVNKEDTI